MTYDDIHYSTAYHTCAFHTHTFASIHPRYNFCRFSVFTHYTVRNCEGKSLPWMFEGPHSGHGGTQMPRNWGARGLSACPKLRSLWISKKACYCTLESPENHTAKHWDVLRSTSVALEFLPWLLCTRRTIQRHASCKLSWNDGCKDSVLGRLFWIRQKDMKLDVSSPKKMILWSIVRCFISFVFCKLFKLFLNVLEIVDSVFFFCIPKHRFKTSLAQSLCRAMA